MTADDKKHSQSADTQLGPKALDHLRADVERRMESFISESERLVGIAEFRAERIGSALEQLRARSKLSMDQLAKEMGYKGQSSIQRYLDPGYDLGLRPELVQRFRKALVGKGTPEITDADFQRLVAPSQTLTAPPSTRSSLEDAATSHASLPLLEGQVELTMPSKLSGPSLAAMKLWLELIIKVAETRVEVSPEKK